MGTGSNLLAVVVAGFAAFSYKLYVALDAGKALQYNDADCDLLGADVMVGSEDVVLWKDGVVLVSSGDLRNVFEHGAANAHPGGIYAVDMVKRTVNRVEIEGLETGKAGEFQPHGIYLSNATQRLYVISHTGAIKGSVVEVFDVLSPKLKLKHRRTIRGPWGNHAINDVAEGALDGSDIYVTRFLPHEHPIDGTLSGGVYEKALEMVLGISAVLGRKATYVYRCTVPANLKEESVCTVAEGAGLFTMANGITMSPDRKAVFIVDVLSHYLNVYSRADDGALTKTSEIEMPHALDNVDFDEDSGTLFCGAIPRLIDAFQAHLDPAVKVPGALLQVSLLGTGGLSYALGRSKDVLMHDGGKLSGISAGARYGGISVVGSPGSNGVLVCGKNVQ